MPDGQEAVPADPLHPPMENSGSISGSGGGGVSMVMYRPSTGVPETAEGRALVAPAEETSPVVSIAEL